MNPDSFFRQGLESHEFRSSDRNQNDTDMPLSIFFNVR